MVDIKKPVEIAENIYWVGYKIPNDKFQCHVYLIKNGKESALIDPGSMITYRETRRKIKQLMDLNDIKYFICQHQDPDIVSCMQEIFNEVGTKDKYVVTHWRAWALLKHYNWNVELYEIEQNLYTLKLGNRRLRFIKTPYLHFPGAFCTFDERTNTLFSSDIFGGFTEKFELFAKSADDYFGKMKPFHEHYMPDNAILNHGLDNIEKCQPINLIAPQHGSIIKKEFIKPIISKLRTLKCGLFIGLKYTREIEKLSKLNDALSDIIEVIAYQNSFFSIINKIILSMKNFYHIDYIKAFIATKKEDEIIVMDSDKRSISIMGDIKKTRDMLNTVHYMKGSSIFYDYSALHKMFGIKDTSYVFPIKDKREKIYGACFVVLNSNSINIPNDLEIMHKFEIPISMAILNERKIFCLENDRKKLYEDSMKDALTGLFNRRYMDLFAEQEFNRAKRYKESLSAIMFDIDHFKTVNDTFSHQAGDLVLQTIAKHIKSNTRSADISIRYGGEEFLVILINTEKRNAFKAAEKIRNAIENMTINFAGNKINCTISGGVASTEDDAENINQLIMLADGRLYKAKNSGRNLTISDL